MTDKTKQKALEETIQGTIDELKRLYGMKWSADPKVAEDRLEYIGRFV